MTIVREGMRKAEIYQILNKISQPEVRKEMIEVLQKTRNCPEKQAKDIKTLRPNEVSEVLKRFDYEFTE